jgi:arginyl-tRNA synthetase
VARLGPVGSTGAARLTSKSLRPRALDSPDVPPADLAVQLRAAATTVLTGHGYGVAALPAEIDLVRPPNPEHGDYATSLALRTAAALDVAPRTLAGWLASELVYRGAVTSADVAGPGFVNLWLAPGADAALVGEVLEQRKRYGAGTHASRVAALVGEVLGTCTAAAGWDTLVAAAGLDAARYALVRRSAEPNRRLDVEPLARQTEDNPVFAVRYLHARLCSLAAAASALGLTPAHGRFEHPAERALIHRIGEFSDVLHTAAELGEPHRLPRYLETLAVAFHHFYDHNRVLPMGDEPNSELYGARVALCLATRQVLANGLRLLGVSAPERL